MIDSKNLLDRVADLIDAKENSDSAKYFGVSRKQISQWRMGHATPPYAKFISLAVENKINLNWLFWGLGDKYLSGNELSVIADNNDNYYHALLEVGLNDYEKKELDIVVNGFQYAPKAFIKQVVDRFAEYKKSFLDMKI